MKKEISILICIIGLFIISGCTTDQTLLIKKNFNTFNNFYADGISCSSFKGSNLTGSNPSVNRQISFSNFPIIVIADTFYLNKNYDYTVSSVNTSYIINFNNPIWNDMNIDVCLATSNTTISNSVYLGINCSGSDGQMNRQLITNISNPLIVSVDNFPLSIGYDYSINLNTITFINKIYDSQVISIWG